MNGQQLPSQSAHMVFDNLKTSDGLSLPHFALVFNYPPAPYLTWIVLDPVQDPNLQNIPGLTQQIGILWNDRTGQIILCRSNGRIPSLSDA